MQVSRIVAVILAVASATAADFSAPAAGRYAQITGTGTVLPGGRFLKPFGTQIYTGPSPFSVVVSPKGTIATADIGYSRYGITLIEFSGGVPSRVRHVWARTPHSTVPEIADPDWKGVSAGIAFDSEKSFWVSEGASGRIRQIDVSTGDHKRIVNLNNSEWRNSFTGDISYDTAHHILYVVDRANSRVALVDARSGRLLSSIRLGDGTFAIGLSPDGGTAYVTESASVSAIDVRDSSKPEVLARIPTPSPQAVLATADRVFVSNARDDSITVISAVERKILTEIPLRIPSLESFRGIVPAGLAYDPVTKWLLVAEFGINAVGVIDTEKRHLIGHLAAGWAPTQIAIAGDRVFVANSRGRGTGPNTRPIMMELGEVPTLHRGSVTTFVMPGASEILRQTDAVLAYNGFVPHTRDVPKLPAAIRHVVWIVKQNRSFDEVLGDVKATALGFPGLARFGMHGRANGGRTQFSVQDAPITPNQHAIAESWAFNDNFYADGETKAEGEIWLRDAFTDPVTISGILAGNAVPDTGKLWDHLQRGGVTFQSFDEGEDTGIPDQQRAGRFIADIDRRYATNRDSFPQFLFIHLPNDRTAEPKPENGYPYGASFVEDNDLATGKILEYLSHSPWWRNMAVFITETDTQGSLDHIDSHRTLLLAAGPNVRRKYVSHTNASFPALLRTTFELLGLPPWNLMDASAASLRDIFTEEPDFTPFTALAPDQRIFDPATLPPQ